MVSPSGASVSRRHSAARWAFRIPFPCHFIARIFPIPHRSLRAPFFGGSQHFSSEASGTNATPFYRCIPAAPSSPINCIPGDRIVGFAPSLPQ